MRARLDLTGRTFGDLQVIEVAGSTPRGGILWECHCNRCGSDTMIEGFRLSQKKDCGCRYRESRADLGGQHIGVLQIIKRTGADNHGNILYLCRCDLCGQEKVLPAVSIRSIPKSCGCREHSIEQIIRMSQMGVDKNIINGVNVSVATKKEANHNSQTGVRGVIFYHGKYRASCQVGGKRWIKDGYNTIEEAAAAREEQQTKMLEDAGITGGNI